MAQQQWIEDLVDDLNERWCGLDDFRRQQLREAIENHCPLCSVPKSDRRQSPQWVGLFLHHVRNVGTPVWEAGQPPRYCITIDDLRALLCSYVPEIRERKLPWLAHVWDHLKKPDRLTQVSPGVGRRSREFAIIATYDELAEAIERFMPWEESA